MHLSSETVLDFLEGRLTSSNGEFWRGHLDNCAECRQEISRWEAMKTDLKRTHLSSAPGPDLQKAMQIFPHQPDHGGSRIRSVLAAIIFDSFAEPAFAGARGTSAAAARQVVMRAEEFDIHIKIWGERERRQLLGQLLPRSGKDFVHTARFHLLRNGERIETTEVDDVGEFHFTNIPEGDLSIQMDLPHLTMIGALNVRETT
jgi:hypothetical protein